MGSSPNSLALKPGLLSLDGSLSSSIRRITFGGLLILSFVSIPISINISQIILLLLCAIALGCYLVSFEVDVLAAVLLIALIGIAQAVGITHSPISDKNYLTPVLFLTSLLIGPAMTILARSYPSSALTRMVPLLVDSLLVFLVIECVSRLIFSPYMPVTIGADVSDSFYRYKFSVFFVDSNFVGIAILCLLAIMFAFRERIGRNKWILAYLLLLATLSRASIAAGICQLVIYKLWRWRVWTLVGLLAAQVILTCALLASYTTQGSESIQSIDGSLSSKLYILTLMTSTYDQADMMQRLCGIGVGNLIGFAGIFAHNIVVTFILELGIGGSILFAAYIWIQCRRCPVSIYLLILPVTINGFSLVSTSMPYFFVALGLLGALRGSERGEVVGPANESVNCVIKKG